MRGRDPVGSDVAANVLICVLGAGIALSVSSWLAAVGVCSIQSCRVAVDPPVGMIGVLAGHSPAAAWRAPGMSGFLFWLAWLFELGALAWAGLWAWRRWGGQGRGRQGDPHKVKGLATASQVRRCFSAATVAAMVWLRPDLERPTAWDLAVRVGTCRGQVCWIPIEDSVAVSAPSRSGKTRWLAYGVVVEFPGAVVTTSVRGELAAGTIMHRKQRGPVAVFAPTGIDAEGEAGAELRRATIRWSLTRGCETPEVALRRAAALAANGGQGTGNDAFWKEHGIRVLAPMLMAAAVSGQGAEALDRWSDGPGQAKEAVRILSEHPNAYRRWADVLGSELSGDHRTVDNIWATVQSIIGRPLMDPRVKEAISPTPGMELDIEDFIDRCGTLYIVGDSKATAAPFVAALIEDVYATAIERANRSKGGRLCPPLGMVFDEIANIATLPSLPTIVSAGGGSGVMPWNFEQSRAQLAARYGREAAEAIWDSATTKLVLGGATKTETLNEISGAIGDRQTRRRTVSSGRDHMQSSWAETEEKILIGSQIRELPKGVMLLLKANTPAALIDGMTLEDRLRRRGRKAPPLAAAPSVHYTTAAPAPPAPAIQAPQLDERHTSNEQQ